MKIEELLEEGKLPEFAWPGGYPIIYLDHDNSTLCSNCATNSLNDPDEVESFRPCAFQIYWEGPSVFCTNCNKEIESAYGDPSEKGE